MTSYSLNISWARLRAVYLNFVAGLGLIFLAGVAIYLSGLVLTWAGGAVVPLLPDLSTPVSVVGAILGVLLVVGVLWTVFFMTVYLLDEAGIELGPKLVWLIIPVLPGLFLVLALFFSVGAIAGHLRNVKWVAGLAAGAAFIIFSCLYDFPRPGWVAIFPIPIIILLLVLVFEFGRSSAPEA